MNYCFNVHIAVVCYIVILLTKTEVPYIIVQINKKSWFNALSFSENTYFCTLF